MSIKLSMHIDVIFLLALIVATVGKITAAQ